MTKLEQYFLHNFYGDLENKTTREQVEKSCVLIFGKLLAPAYRKTLPQTIFLALVEKYGNTLELYDLMTKTGTLACLAAVPVDRVVLSRKELGMMYYQLYDCEPRSALSKQQIWNSMETYLHSLLRNRAFNLFFGSYETQWVEPSW